MPGTHDVVPDDRNANVLIYVNGQWVPRPEAKVSVFDAGFLVGDGVWEGIRYHEGSFLYLGLHIDRLFEGLAAIGLDLGMTRTELIGVLDETVSRNNMTTDVHVRLMVTRGEKKTPSQHPYLVVGGPTVVVIAEHKKADPEAAAAGLTLFTSTVRRPPPDSLDPKLNCHSKLHEVIALIQALEAGADEALMLDPTGAVSTCNSTHFFIVRHGELWTSDGLYCMNGITRRIVLELARADGLVAREKPYSLTDVYAAEEAFVTGTFGGLTPVAVVDGRRIGASALPGPVTSRLTALYDEAKAGARHR